MLVLLLTQRKCDCTREECPGYDDDITLWLEEASDVRDAVDNHVSSGGRVISAYPASKVTDLLSRVGNKSHREYSGEGSTLRTSIPSKEANMPPGFGRNNYSRGNDFYLDPRADSTPVVNPVFDKTPTEPFTPALKVGDKVLFAITEEFNQEFYTKGCGPTGEYYVSFVSEDKVTLSDLPNGMVDSVMFSTYPLFVKVVGE